MYFIKGEPKGNVFDMLVLTLISFGFIYGVLAIYRDLKKYGKLKLFTDLIDKLKW